MHPHTLNSTHSGPIHLSHIQLHSVAFYIQFHSLTVGDAALRRRRLQLPPVVPIIDGKPAAFMIKTVDRPGKGEATILYKDSCEDPPPTFTAGRAPPPSGTASPAPRPAHTRLSPSLPASLQITRPMAATPFTFLIDAIRKGA